MPKRPVSWPRKKKLPTGPDEIELLACSCSEGWLEGEELSILNLCIGIVEREMREQLKGAVTNAPNWARVAAWRLLDGWRGGQTDTGAENSRSLRSEEVILDTGGTLSGMPSLSGGEVGALPQRQVSEMAGREHGDVPGNEVAVETPTKLYGNMAKTYSLGSLHINSDDFFMSLTLTPQALVQRVARMIRNMGDCAPNLKEQQRIEKLAKGEDME